jgi:outer membrane protein assembly factor BamE
MAAFAAVFVPFFSIFITHNLRRFFKRMIFSRFASAVLFATVFSGCSSVPRLVTEYRIDVQQGNVVTQEMASQLRPGLSRDQVRFVLGTPMLIDMFHADRWDYVYRLQKGRSGEVEMRKLSIFFDAGGKLLRVEGDVEPAQTSDVSLAPETRSRVIDLGSLPDDGRAPLPSSEEKSLFGKMMESVGW